MTHSYFPIIDSDGHSIVDTVTGDETNGKKKDRKCKIVVDFRAAVCRCPLPYEREPPPTKKNTLYLVLSLKVEKGGKRIKYD